MYFIQQGCDASKIAELIRNQVPIVGLLWEISHCKHYNNLPKGLLTIDDLSTGLVAIDDLSRGVVTIDDLVTGLINTDDWAPLIIMDHIHK